VVVVFVFVEFVEEDVDDDEVVVVDVMTAAAVTAACSACKKGAANDVEMPSNFIKTANIDGAAMSGAGAARNRARN
jgi:uncharacterized metal-binding protein YceD (DUF177 family)